MKSATLYATIISPHHIPTDVIRIAAGGGQRQLRGGAESDGHGELSEGRTGERGRLRECAKKGAASLVRKRGDRGLLHFFYGDVVMHMARVV